jgi:hypothetical protein
MSVSREKIGGLFVTCPTLRLLYPDDVETLITNMILLFTV